ncbi:hypothetical protein Tco_0920118 [Tanacetum coccineum]
MNSSSDLKSRPIRAIHNPLLRLAICSSEKPLLHTVSRGNEAKVVVEVIQGDGMARSLAISASNQNGVGGCSQIDILAVTWCTGGGTESARAGIINEVLRGFLLKNRMESLQCILVSRQLRNIMVNVGAQDPTHNHEMVGLESGPTLKGYSSLYGKSIELPKILV